MKQHTVADGIVASYSPDPSYLVVEDLTLDRKDVVSVHTHPLVYALIEELMAAAEE